MLCVYDFGLGLRVLCVGEYVRGKGFEASFWKGFLLCKSTCYVYMTLLSVLACFVKVNM